MTPASRRSSPIRPRRGPLACLCLLLACGDDDGGDEGGVTGPAGSSGPSASSTDTTAAGSSSGPADSSSSGVGPGSSGSSGEGSTTGTASDPVYPQPDGGACPGNTFPVTLPQSEICAPACTGRGDACPAAATGDAPAQCTPFLSNGGSGDPCDEVTPCGAGEACDAGGMCVEVAFWACQLVCAGGESCPDGMVCNGIQTCGYP